MMRIHQIEENEYGLKQVQVRLNLREASSLYSDIPVRSPQDAVNVMKEMMRELDREMVCVVNLDNRNRPINFNICSIGSLNSSTVTMSNVFKSALLSNAASVMLMHNHPSGSVMPSPEDDEITRRVIRAGELMDISLTDHLIIGGVSGEYYSYMSEKPEMFRHEEGVRFFEPGETYTDGNGEGMDMTNMNFSEFTDYMKEHIRDRLPGPYREQPVEIRKITRSDSVYTAMIVRKEGEHISPLINLDRLYRSYTDGVPLGFLLGTAAETIEFARPDLGFSEQMLSSYENMRDHLYIRIHDSENDAELLKTVPHIDAGPFSATVHIMLESSADGMKSAIITNDMLERLGVAKGQLYEDALASSRKLFPLSIRSMGDMLRELSADTPYSQDLPEMPKMLVVTNEQGMNGAAAFLYPGISQSVSAILGGDYFILPSSIHELILLPVSEHQDYRELEDMVRSVNRNVVLPEDQLSDRVYYYDSRKQEVSRAEDTIRKTDRSVHEEPETYSVSNSLKDRKSQFRKAAAESFIKLLQPDNPVKSFEWIKEWRDAARPESMRSGMQYRGINHAVLTMEAIAKGYSDPRWTTMNYLKYRKGMGVKKGEHGCLIEYWLAKDLTKKPGEYMGVITTDQARAMIQNGLRKESDFALVPRYSTVFNAEQCYGIPKLEKQEEKKEISQAEMVSKISKNMQVPIIHDPVSIGCYYSVLSDEVHLPEPQNFTSEYAYNASALHELAHASGAANRLDRNIRNEFGSDDYAFEELVAEMTSCFTAAELIPDERGMEEYTKLNAENHYKYVKGWAESLRSDPDCLVKAVKLAELSSDYLDLNAGLLSLQEYNRRHARDHRADMTEDGITSIIRKQTQPVTMPDISLPSIEIRGEEETRNRSVSL